MTAEVLREYGRLEFQGTLIACIVSVLEPFGLLYSALRGNNQNWSTHKQLKQIKSTGLFLEK